MTRNEARRLGGLAVRQRQPPDECPRCGKSMAGRKWHSYLGHLGLHGLADNHFGGDIEAAQERLRQNSLALQEQGASWSNGAWGAYQPVMERADELDPEEVPF